MQRPRGMKTPRFKQLTKVKSNAGKVVVVTGASAGVGRATIREFARQGAKIGLIARGWEGLEAARREVVELGGEALVLPLDVSDSGALDKAATSVEEKFGPIDVWVNVAMVTVFSPVKEMLPEEFRRVTEVTYLGYVYGTLAALKRMLPRDRGVIVQVGSALAYRSIPLQSAYCAAKHAVAGFTESLRTELLHDRSGVKITIVQLPAVNTPQFTWNKTRMPRHPQPVPPIFQPEVPARAIAYASEHPRKEFDLGWPTVKAIQAEKWAPGVADHYLARYGYDAQMTDEPVSPDRPNNLWHPLPGDYGAHGEFDSRSKSFSLQFWLDSHRGLLALGLGAAGALATLALTDGGRKPFEAKKAA